MSKVGKEVKRILAVIVAAALVFSPVLSRTVQAEGETYTAYSSTVSEDQPLDYFYLTDADGVKIVSYCLNANRHFPLEEGKGGTPNYAKVAVRAENADEINNLVGGPNPPEAGYRPPHGQGEALRRRLIAIIENGYDTAAGAALAAEKQVTDPAMQIIATQYAIWYYTDGVTDDGNAFGSAASFVNHLRNSGKLTQAEADAVTLLLSDENAQTEGISEERRQELAEISRSVGNTVALCDALKQCNVSEEYAKHRTLYIYGTTVTETEYIHYKWVKTYYQNLIGVDSVVEDPKVPVTLSKRELNGGGDELPGASLKVVAGQMSADEAKNADAVKDALNGETLSWTSGNAAKTFSLYPGVYTMVEMIAPKHYDMAEAISFEIGMDQSITILGSEGELDGSTVIMKDKIEPSREVTFSKVAAGQGEELQGALITVYETDENGNVTGTAVPQYTSGGGAKTWTLYAGYYRMVEDQAPLGYEKAESIDFRVVRQPDDSLVLEVKGPDGAYSENAKVQMTDDPSPYTTVKVLKVDKATGTPVEGATLQITNDVNQEVKTVVSGKEAVEVTPLYEYAEGNDYTEYTLKETAAPAGYKLTDETITFRVVRNTDANGNVRAHVEIKDENGEWQPQEAATLIVENEKIPETRTTTTPDPGPTPDPTPTPGPAPDPGTPVTPAPAPVTTTVTTPQVLGEQRPTGTDGQQAVLGARRAEAKTSDNAPIRILFFVMGIAGAGLVAAVAQWTKPQAASKKRRTKARRR